MYCSQCGAGLAGELKFCGQCGATVRVTEDHAAPDTETWMATFIGPKNQDYYLRHFTDFENRRNAGISWNWPAFFVTFYWLLYRKMWLNAIIYWLLPYLLMIPLMILVVVMGNNESSSLIFTIGYVIYLMAYFFLPPMYANALYFRHYQKKLAETKQASRDTQRQLGMLSEKGGTSPIAIIVLMIFSFVFMFGILAAIAIPAYQDYTVRAKIAEGLNTAAAAKLAVSESYLETGTVPADNTAAGFVFKKDAANVRDIQIEDGVITIVMAASPVEGGSIILEPSKGADDSIVWDCYSPDIEKKYLPASCRE